MSRKNLGKLVPIKKTVFDKKKETSFERTYYIDPQKGRKKGKKETLTPKKLEKGTLNLKEINNYDDFAKQGIDPNAAKQFFCGI